MSKKNNHQPSDTDKTDDLLRIRGIGQSIAHSLNNIGIYTLYDLASYTQEALIERMRNQVPPLTLQRIVRDDWIGQARALIQELETTSNEAESPPTSLANEAMNYLSSGGMPGTDNPEVPHPSWQEVADFFVSLGYTVDSSGKRRLGTKVHHSQADEMQEWDGLAMPELAQWMLAQAGLADSAIKSSDLEQTGTPERSKTETKPISQMDQPAQPVDEAWDEPGVELELSDLWVSETDSTDYAQSGGQLTSRLRVECVLNLTGARAEALTYEQTPYSLEVYLVNNQTNLSKQATQQSGQLEPGQLSYPFLQDFGIPPVGNYQIYVLARLQTPGAPATHLQGPVLQVET